MMAAGNAYETRALRHFDRSSWSGLKLRPRQWIGYEDGWRRCAAQPDCYAELDDRIVVFEIKLTRCEEGFLQLERVYFPLLSALFKLPVAGVLVFRNPGSGYMAAAEAAQNLRTALATPINSIAEWHLLV